MKKEFTARAKAKWDSLPQDIKGKLLSNVWCGYCMGVTTIVDFKGQVQAGDLVLRGYCVKCGGEVARVIESE
jgi:hypothetical protein